MAYAAPGGGGRTRRWLAEEEGLDLGTPTGSWGPAAVSGRPGGPGDFRGPAVPVVRATSVDPAVPADRATSVDPAVPADRATSVDPAVPATSDRDLSTPSEASVVPRGVMAQRRGAGGHLREPGGADPFRRPAASGTKGHQLTGGYNETPIWDPGQNGWGFYFFGIWIRFYAVRRQGGRPADAGAAAGDDNSDA